MNTAAKLDGVVVVTDADTDAGASQAHTLVAVARGRVVWLRSPRLGALAAELRSGGRVAVFCGDATREAATFRELVAELFAPDSVGLTRAPELPDGTVRSTGNLDALGR